MTKMTPLIERNKHLARTYNAATLGIPSGSWSSSPASTTGSTLRSSSGSSSAKLPSSATPRARHPRRRRRRRFPGLPGRAAVW